jgi:hypothetical protein
VGRSFDILIGVGLGLGLCALVALVWSLVLQPRGSPTRSNQASSYQNQTGTTENDEAQNQRVAENQQGRTAQNQRGTDEPPKEQESGETDALTRYTKWLMVFTGVLALATIILAISTIGLWRYAGEQASDTKRLIAATRATAGAAKQSADIAQQGLISTQRAFVFINSFEVHVIGGEIRIIPKWENSGATPANPMHNYVNWKPFNGEIPLDYGYPDLGKDGLPLPGKGSGAQFFVGPKAIMLGNTVQIPIAVMEAARAGNIRVFIWEWAEYNDIFNKAKSHEVTFCYEIVVTDLGSKDDKTTIAAAFTIYGPHNSAEQENYK